MKRLVLLAALTAAPAHAAPPAPSFSIDNVSADESAGSVNITVRKHGRLNGSRSTVTFRTADSTARAATDYAATTMTLTFSASEIVKTVTVPLVKDTVVEPNETFTARIAAGSNARLYDGSALVTITDAFTLPPEPTPTVPSTPAAGSVPIIPSGVDVAYNLGNVPLAPSGAPDVVGAFRFHCAPSHVLWDDPVIMPGKKGQFHHPHQFFGNKQADANSTYESLRKTGDSTCINELNRSAYWMPALLGKDAIGTPHVVVPQNISIYYKRQPAGSKELLDRGLIGVNLPRGLRYVFGFPDVMPQYKCVNENNWSNVTDWTTMDQALAACQVGHSLYVTVPSPGCWDGKNLDSADHRSHMAHTNNVGQCPATHRYFLPSFTIIANYKIIATDLTATWKFGSDDHLNPGGPRGSSFHADWFGAWEDSILDAWHANCINKLLNCSTGDLGNGKALLFRPPYEEALRAPPQRLPVPPRFTP